MLDITERKQTEVALLESEERYRFLVENTNETIFRTELRQPLPLSLPTDEAMAWILREAHLEAVNEGFVRAYGYDRPDELIGQPMSILFPNNSENEAMIRALVENGHRIIETRSEEVDRLGQRKVFLNSIVGRIENGYVYEYMGTARDVTRRVLAEEALVAQEKRYRYIFDAVGVSIWEEDFAEVKTAIDRLKDSGVENFHQYFVEHPEFVDWAIGSVRLLDVNDATLQILGAQDKNQVLTSLHEIALPETRQAFVDEFLAIAAGETFIQSETVIKTLQGERVPVLFSIAFPPPTESYERVLVTLFDIRDRKQAEIALQESESRFQRLAANIPGAIYQYVTCADGSKKLTYISSRSRDIYEYEPEALMENFGLVWQMIHPEDVEHLRANSEDSSQQVTPFNVEFRIQSPSGKLKWLKAGSLADPQENGDIIWDGLVIDVTERKQTEAALKERSDYIRLLYETTRDLLSTEQPLSLVENLFTKLKSLIGLDIYFNYLMDEATQKLHLGFYGGISEELARSIEWLDQGQAVCGMVAEQRCQIVQPDVQQSIEPQTELIRSLGLTAYSCQPLLAQGKLFGTLGFGSRSRIEFTAAETNLFQAVCDQIAIALERAALVTSLQQQTEELQTTNRLKDDFFSALSHELRTPLSPILGWTKIMQEQTLAPAKLSHALTTIERNIHQQIRLVDDLLDVSRVIQGKFQLDSDAIDLVQILNAAIATVTFAAQAKSVSLTFTHPERLATVGDGDRLQQVFWNLLSNAIKFTPEQGQVEVRLELLEGEFINRRDAETQREEEENERDPGLPPTPYSLLPTPHSPLPTPHSPLPTPHSPLPTPTLKSLSRTPASALRQTFCPISSSTSGRRRTVRRGSMGGWGWGWRSCGIWWRRMGA